MSSKKTRVFKSLIAIFYYKKIVYKDIFKCFRFLKSYSI